MSRNLRAEFIHSEARANDREVFDGSPVRGGVTRVRYLREFVNQLLELSKADDLMARGWFHVSLLPRRSSPKNEGYTRVAGNGYPFPRNQPTAMLFFGNTAPAELRRRVIQRYSASAAFLANAS